MFTKAIAVVALTAAVLVAPAAAGNKEDMKQACDMCKNMGMGGSGQKWACPKAVAKECMININGWCCRDSKEHASCATNPSSRVRR